MRYLMLVLTDPALVDTEEPPATIEQWVDEAYGTGRAVEGDRLRPASEEKIVRRRGGRVLVSDGPFSESHELIGGFDVLECATLDEAIELAARHPMATAGTIVLRPAWPLDL